MEQLTDPYHQRARVLAVPINEYQAAASPAAALEIVLRSFSRSGQAASSSPPADSGPLLTHQLEAVNYLAGDEPQRTVLLQRLLIDLLAERIAVQKPKARSAAAQIRAELAAADAAAEDLLLQLRGGERATLEMGMLYAVP
jgi:hypothetical protein